METGRNERDGVVQASTELCDFLRESCSLISLGPITPWSRLVSIVVHPLCPFALPFSVSIVHTHARTHTHTHTRTHVRPHESEWYEKILRARAISSSNAERKTRRGGARKRIDVAYRAARQRIRCRSFPFLSFLLLHFFFFTYSSLVQRRRAMFLKERRRSSDRADRTIVRYVPVLWKISTCDCSSVRVIL